MLDAETLRKIWNAPALERIALIEVILQSFQEHSLNDTESPSERYFRFYSHRAQSTDHETLLSNLEILSSQWQRQLANASEQLSQRPSFGFMQGTGTIHGDIVSPAVPEGDWEVLQ